MQPQLTYIVVITCLLLATVLVWLEIKRANKHWLLWRIAGVMVACAMLACLALPISYRRPVDQNSDHQVILLTDGFNAQQIANEADAKVYTLEASVKSQYPKAALLSDIAVLHDTLKANKLHVYGNGLNGFELQELDSTPLVFHPGTTPAGVINISYNNTIKTGEAFRVQGVYNNTSAQKVKLALKGSNTALDSVTVPANAQTLFNLSAIPKVTGRVSFALYADTVLQGNMPVQITDVKPLKVLMLSASPDFESRFLKNWLSENGYVVAARSAISKGKFNTDLINTAPVNLDKLTSATLSKFDAVVGDLSVLNALSGPESTALRQEISENGLGIVVKADSAGEASWLQKSFPVNRPSTKEPAPSALVINGKKTASNKLSSTAAFITYQNGTQALASNMQNQVLASSTILGAGKLVFTTLGNTFSWMLAGDKKDYTSLWNALLNKAARKSSPAGNQVLPLTLPYVNQPVALQVNLTGLVPVDINKEQVALAQNLNLPFTWNVNYWPEAVGWQGLRQNNQLGWWYAHDKNEWEGLRAAAKISATNKYVNAHQITDIVTKQIHQTVRIEVPKIYFYILLLAACTLLWVENKFS